MSNNKIVEIKKGEEGKGLLIENDGFVSLSFGDNVVIKESIENSMPNDGGDLIKLPNPFVVSAVFQKYGVENANGRIYPEEILKREVEKYKQALSEKRSYGELNHPESAAIDLDRIAMYIIELHWEGNTLVGKIVIPITEGFRKYGIVSTKADLFAHWLISGLKVGVSSRGLGSVRKELGKMIVSDDFEIVCWDVVSQPSTPGAWCYVNDDIMAKEMKESEKNIDILPDFNNEEGGKYEKFKNWLSNI